MRRTTVLGLMAFWVLSACYLHDQPYMSTNGREHPLPDATALYNPSDDSMYVLQRSGSGYDVPSHDDFGVATFQRLDGAANTYWMQVEQFTDDGTSYLSFPMRIARGEAALYGAAVPLPAESRAELMAQMRENLSEPISDGRTFEIIDISTQGGRLRATALIEQRQADAEAEDTAEPQAQVGSSGSVHPQVSANGVWHYVEQEDVMDGSLRQFIFGVPQGIDPQVALSQGPYIRIGCYDPGREYEMGLTIRWNARLFDMFPDEPMDATRITARFGQDDPVELGFEMSEDRIETYPPSAMTALGGGLTAGLANMFVPNNANAQTVFNWGAQDVHLAIANTSRTALRGYAISGPEITLIFDGAGYSSVAQNFRHHCNNR